MTQAWIRDGLHPRAITRDLKWGIPVPKKGFEGKVFYVWFDAPIGYISMTAKLAKERGFDWRAWWQNPEEVELFQFIGKDNIPFHTVIFPSSLLGSGKPWTMLHHMSSTEYLNYEAGKFSKSKGIGVFGTDAMETDIPADIWRFYIFWNRPETSDYVFTWKDFEEKVNGELIGNLGNLVNRTLTFVSRYYSGIIPHTARSESFWNEIMTREKRIAELLDKAELREALREIFAIADIANKRFQEEEPWKARAENPDKAESLMMDLCYVLKDLAILLHPYLPESSNTLAEFFGLSVGKNGLSWKDLGVNGILKNVQKPHVLFQKLEHDAIELLRERYSGSQKEREIRSTQKKQNPVQHTAQKPPVSEEELAHKFNTMIDLRVARITKVERHPEADKLYIESLDDGSGNPRIIVSGLVPFYKEEELLGKQIILVNNLKPATLRGVESAGMLLAASIEEADGHERVEVLTAQQAKPGDRIVLENYAASIPRPQEPLALVDAATFFSIPLVARDGFAWVGQYRLCAAGQPLQLENIKDGEIG